MRKNVVDRRLVVGVTVLVACLWNGVLAPAVYAHHSFAMYDQNQTKTLTGRLTRYIPGANHAQLIFEVLGPVHFPGVTGARSAEAVGAAARTAPAASVQRMIMVRIGIPPSRLLHERYEEVFHAPVPPWQGLGEALVKPCLSGLFGATPEGSERARQSLGLDSMRWVEVVALLEHLQLEVREHSA